MNDAAAPAIEPLGETALLIRIATRIDAASNARALACAAMLADAELPGIVDIVPAYASLALHYDPAAWTGGGDAPPWRKLASAVRTVFALPPGRARIEAREIEIEIAYGGEFGPDLDALARHAGLAADEVVRRHAAAEYKVAMLGFAPGFPYLLGLDPALAMPRRADPRLRVPAGSVAIGGAQTGIYPRDLPGGWQLIGRTPAVLFDVARERPCLFAPGDRVRFVAIDRDAFARRRADAPA